MGWKKLLTTDGDHIVNEQGRQDHVSNTMAQPYYRFDMVDDNVLIADNPLIDDIFTNGGSAEAWVYPLSDGENSYGRILDKANWTLHIFAESGGLSKIRFYITTSGDDGEWFTTNVCVPNDKWSHIAVTYDNGSTSNNPIIYLNGVSQSLTENTTPAAVQTSDDGSALYIGNRAAGDVTWDGQIAGVKLFNNTLTAPEVKELYSGASVPFKYKGANQTSLITGDDSDFDSATGFWTLNAGSGTSCTIADSKLKFNAIQSGYGAQRVALVTAGKRYRCTFTISSYSAGNVAVYMNGTYSANFGANGTHTVEMLAGYANTHFWINGIGTTTLNVDDVTLVPIGAVAEYDGSGATGTTWHDKSGNNLDGTVSGATLENKARYGYLDLSSPLGTSGSAYPTADGIKMSPVHFTGYQEVTSGTGIIISEVFYNSGIADSRMAGTLEVNYTAEVDNNRSGYYLFRIQYSGNTTVTTVTSSTTNSSATAVKVNAGSAQAIKITPTTTSTQNVLVYYEFKGFVVPG